MDNAHFWFQDTSGGGGGGDAGDPIGQSLRFRGSSSLTGPDARSGTISVWVKRGKLGAVQDLFMAGISYAANDTLNGSTAVYRDPSAWYHVVLNINGTYVNGERVANGQGFRTQFIGLNCELYLADLYCIDGQALEPTTFGRYNTAGVWVPVNYDGTYGTNGFHLTFDPTQDPDPQVAIGIDSSGNDNHFTSTGFEVGNQTSADYDLMLDSPTQNHATLNPLIPGVPGLTDANLTCEPASPGRAVPQTMAFGATGKFQAEYYLGNNSFNQLMTFAPSPLEVFNYGGPNGLYWTSDSSNSPPQNNSATPFKNGTYSQVTSTGPGTGWVANSTIGITWDGTDLNLYLDGELKTTYSNFPADQPPLYFGGGNNNVQQNLNYGQQPFLYPVAGFNGIQSQNLPEATITDGRDHFRAITGGIGQLFKETGVTASTDPVVLTEPIPINTESGIPEVFSIVVDCGGPLNTANVSWLGNMGVNPNILLSIDGTTWRDLGPQTISGGVSSTYSDGSDFRFIRMFRNTVFTNGIVTATGFSILALAQQTFPNGLWWIKDRANSNQHQLVDSIKGQVGGNWQANLCPAVGADVDYVAPAGNSVAWCWSAPEAFTDNSGAVPATGFRNVDAGFSMITWEGLTSGNSSVAHGLGRPVDFVIARAWTRSGPRNLRVYVRGGMTLPGSLYLNENITQTNEPCFWQDPDDTLLYLGDELIDALTPNGIGYAWASTPGYSAFGSYTGNGSADGPFIYTGFRPAWIMTKRVDSTSNWIVMDSTINLNNPATLNLKPNLTDEEKVANDRDFLSNGFKIRVTTSNESGGTYIYAAFAEMPQGGNNVSPANAR